MANGIIAFFTIVIAVATIAYVWLTRKLWKETKKSADAASKAADAAQQSVQLTRQQIEEQAGLGKQIVQTTIDSAVNAINYWLGQDLANFGVVRCLSPTENLLPKKETSALDHAARIDPAGAAKLSSAFDDLHKCCAEIERFRTLAALPGMSWQGMAPSAEQIRRLLGDTLQKFSDARLLLL